MKIHGRLELYLHTKRIEVQSKKEGGEMIGVVHNYHYAANKEATHRWQCHANGKIGKYVIRQYGEDEWWAIQLFGAIGGIAGEGKTPEEAFENAERK